MHNTRAQAASLQLGNGVNQEHVFVKPALPRRVGLVTPGFNFDPDREPFYLVNPNPNMQNFPHGHQNIQAIQPQQLSLATASTTMTMFRPQESPFAPSSTTTVMVQPQQFPLTTGSATTPIVQPQELPIATSSNSTTMVRGGGGTNTVENSNKRSRTTEEDSPTPSKGSRKSRLQLSASGSKKATSGPPKPYGKPLVWASVRSLMIVNGVHLLNSKSDFRIARLFAKHYPITELISNQATQPVVLVTDFCSTKIAGPVLTWTKRS